MVGFSIEIICDLRDILAFKMSFLQIHNQWFNLPEFFKEFGAFFGNVKAIYIVKN